MVQIISLLLQFDGADHFCYKPMILTNDMVSDTEQREEHSGFRVFKCLKWQIKHTWTILAHLKGTKCVFCSNILTVFIHPVFTRCYLHCPVL